MFQALRVAGLGQNVGDARPAFQSLQRSQALLAITGASGEANPFFSPSPGLMSALADTLCMLKVPEMDDPDP